MTQPEDLNRELTDEDAEKLGYGGKDDIVSDPSPVSDENVGEEISEDELDLLLDTGPEREK